MLRPGIVGMREVPRSYDYRHMRDMITLPSNLAVPAVLARKLVSVHPAQILDLGGHRDYHLENVIRPSIRQNT